MKKWTYGGQLWIGLILVLAGLACSTVFQKPWLGNLGWIVCGGLFLLHPVCPAGTDGRPRMKCYVRLSGLVVILLGLSIRFGG